MGCRSTNCTVYSAKYHLIWCQKYRVLAGAVEARLVEIIREVVVEHDVVVLELEVMPDHVHCVV